MARRSQSQPSTLLASISSLKPSQLHSLLEKAQEEQRKRLSTAQQQSSEIWKPFPGPQTEALQSKADVLLFGGAAGGGKDLHIETMLPSPDDFIRMGDIKVGDALF